MKSDITYRPEIDGLRSVAVIGVLIYHINPAWLPGGYLGVDVFFVISGFLITSIIMSQLDGGSFSLIKFWDRRIRRIVPAASSVIAITTIVHAALFYLPDLHPFSMQKIASLLSFANIHFWKESGSYWGTAAQESPYLHYWSLAVEEQYYLIYPIVLAFVYRHARHYIPGILLALFALSWTLFIYGSSRHPEATFYLLPTRLWELGAGCLLAVAIRGGMRMGGVAATSLGLALIGSVYAFAGRHNGVGVEAFVAVMGAVLVIASGTNRVSGAILENRCSVYVGRISYSLYLWHWPVLVTFAMLSERITIQFPVLSALVVIFVLSVLTYYAIESPFRNMPRASPFLLAWVALLSVIFYIEKDMYLHRNYMKAEADQPSWHGLYYDVNPHLEVSRDDLKSILATVDAPWRDPGPDAYKAGGYIHEHGDPVPRIVVLGDSHAVMWSRLIDEIAKDLGVTVAFWAMNGPDPFLDVPVEPARIGWTWYLSREEKAIYDQSRLRLVKQWEPDVVILAARWEEFQPQRPRALLDYLSRHANHIMLLESPPVLKGVGDRNTANYLSWLGVLESEHEDMIWSGYDMAAVEAMATRLLGYAEAYKKVSVLPVADLYVAKSGVRCSLGCSVYYLDDDHLSDEGIELMRERITMQLRSLINN